MAVPDPGSHLVARRKSSGNWAGAVHTTPSSSVSFVTGTVTLPEYKRDPELGASFWVGIDGATCRTAILQTGIDYLHDTIYPWYEWYPADSKFYAQPLSAKPGDRIRMGVNATSATSGVATLENLTTGGEAYAELKDQARLCLRDAEWVVEDVANGLVDFGVVRFSDVEWHSLEGRKGASAASVYDVEKGGRQSTRCSVSEDVVCKFLHH
ncbi:Concanavalin A-like lectin/glucanase [Metarhizium album ARSEF 1941]|uniref:Concanavalin A-like lectin/glucanase n=1 Tax=Metarhizium album (strain ARSEF 1941) TaxID=1081103 RepID=A0A0B2WSR3_METAS|nr:Concanavalin A-like lectin/glucanase [Metarhizium album ARSEF 1941]KHN99111.1 Concanavalin A-like lectin/glucanase [Metarhizium album ARSEF 1941]